MCYKNVNKLLLTVILLIASKSQATPFESCPSEAFLVQDTVARIYGVNLATGFYEELSDSMGTSGKINAAGFNTYDNYLYGWGYEFQTVVRIDNAYQATPIQVTNLPGASFYVGDVSLSENAYYMYRKGGSYGLYRVALDEEADDFAVAERIVDGSALNLNIYDMAFHPQNGDFYSVDGGGNLIRVNSETGSSSVISNVDQQGTFGAVYFDLSGYLYISRNSDGYIFRIDTSEESPVAEFFAFGPSSGNNDGARCALAPIVSEDSTIDFGDAPESYGTSIENNGARHELSDDLFLGGAQSEDDGIDFVTGFESGLDTLINVNALGEGYLSAWVDWDQNGTFDSNEKVVDSRYLSSGPTRVLLEVPIDAVEGSTWCRFRYSSTEDIGPNGGVSDGEVEDHEIDVTSSGVSIVTYPSENNFVTLAYEDNWPALGDYDMNDVVLAFQTRQYVNELQQVIRYDIKGRVLAIGASYHNGFAVQLDNVPSGNVDELLMRYDINDQAQSTSALEQNDANDDAVIIVTQDLWDHVSAQNSCSYYRTQDGCEAEQRFEFSIAVPLIEPIAIENAPDTVLNPFIFATPGTYHGDGFDSHPGRGLEIHLKNKKASARFNTAFVGMADDESRPEDSKWFLNVNNMPWAIELPTLWNHPKERVDILDAYPEFPEFVESEGQQKTTWYTSSRAVNDRIISNN